MFNSNKPEQMETVIDKDGGSNGSNEYVAQPRRKKGGWIVTLCKRFWWAFLLVLVVVVLAVTLPLVLVGFPRIIQDKVNSATVQINGIRITQPKVDSVWMEMNSTIHSNGGISAIIDPFNASMYLEDKAGHVPFAYLSMPQTSADKVVNVNISQQLDIWNAQAYTDFNTWYLLNESFRVTIDGNTEVHVKGLKSTTVNFHKTITLQGLNGFKGLNVTSFDISITPDLLGDNFKGFATIPNPSVLTVAVGNTSFINSINDTDIGTLFIDNLTLYPGDNNVSIRANVSQTPVLAAVTSQTYCHTGVVPLAVRGDYVVYDNVHLPYYETGFRLNHDTISLNISQALEKTLGSPVTCPKS